MSYEWDNEPYFLYLKHIEQKTNFQHLRMINQRVFPKKTRQNKQFCCSSVCLQQKMTFSNKSID